MEFPRLSNNDGLILYRNWTKKVHIYAEQPIFKILFSLSFPNKLMMLVLLAENNALKFHNFTLKFKEIDH